VEFKVDNPEMIKEYEMGAEIDLESLFNVDELVDVAGTSIGKGFQGSIKRWGHHRGPMTHGEQ
jgi:large subunit ribosomal protein L3